MYDSIEFNLELLDSGKKAIEGVLRLQRTFVFQTHTIGSKTTSLPLRYKIYSYYYVTQT